MASSTNIASSSFFILLIFLWFYKRYPLIFWGKQSFYFEFYRIEKSYHFSIFGPNEVYDILQWLWNSNLNQVPDKKNAINLSLIQVLTILPLLISTFIHS